MSEMTAEEKAKLEAEEKARKEAEESKKNKSDEIKTVSIEQHRKEIQELVEEREKLKNKYRETRDSLAALEKRLEGIPSSEELEKLLNEKKVLEDYKKKIEDEAEAKRLEQASEVEKLQIQLDKLKSSYEAALQNKEDEKVKTSKQLQEEKERLSKENESLRLYRKQSEILTAAEKYKAIKPSQIVDMLSHKFVYDEETNEFVFPVISAKGKREGEKSIESYVKEFLENPDNDNLVKIETLPGSGHYSSSSDNRSTRSSDAQKYMKSERAILEEEAEERGLKVEDWIAIKKAQEERKKKESAK